MKLEIDITWPDYLNFSPYHFKKKSLIRTAIIGLIGLIFLQFSINKNNGKVDIMTIVVSSILYILIFAGIIYFSLARSKSIPKDNGSFLGKKVYEFLEDYISFSDINLNGRFQWNAIKSIEEDSKAFY